jgi:hypothetical protein
VKVLDLRVSYFQASDCKTWTNNCPSTKIKRSSRQHELPAEIMLLFLPRLAKERVQCTSCHFCFNTSNQEGDRRNKIICSIICSRGFFACGFLSRCRGWYALFGIRCPPARTESCKLSARNRTVRLSWDNFGWYGFKAERPYGSSGPKETAIRTAYTACRNATEVP